ncbi:MAG: VWA domain-containing protein, partial [Candidatus Limnocylindrales bacterium]
MPDRAASPILVAPTGELIDGRRLLAESVGFGRALRAVGLPVDLSAAIDFARTLSLVELGRRDQVHDAGAAVFVRRRDDREAYDRVFDQFWRRRGRKLARPRLEGATPDVERDGAEEGASDEAGEEGRAATMTELATMGIQVANDADDGAEIEGTTISPDAYSKSEVQRHRDFDRMTARELRDAERFVDLLRPRLERRRTRRFELHPHGRRLAPRAMFRQNLATGELMEWVWRRQIREPRQLVVLCDISGSMERHSRLLLRFVQALARTNEVRTESFVFGTRLTRVTRVMKDRDRDRALARVADTVTDWAGGTRIGESFREFNRHWARRTLRT